MMGVNVRGHFIALKAQIPLMLETSPSPAIVLTSSVCGHAAYPGDCQRTIARPAGQQQPKPEKQVGAASARGQNLAPPAAAAACSLRACCVQA